MNTIDLQIGKRLRELRITAGITQIELSRRLGWMPTKIINAELGIIRMRVRDLSDLARALEVDIKDFYKGLHI